jgi:hypothetical protein
MRGIADSGTPIFDLLDRQLAIANRQFQDFDFYHCLFKERDCSPEN